jgi:hypothetical protein
VREALVLFIGIAAGVLGYGYWHTENHATFYMSVTERTPAGRYGQVLNAQLEFLDGKGVSLARGKTDGKFGVVWVAHPVAGYCGPDLSKEAYRSCFDAHSVWLRSWVPLVRQVSLAFDNCRIERVPLQFSANRDSMWTWWIPLPHVGGTPYTYYSAHLEVEGRTCSVTSYRG